MIKTELLKGEIALVTGAGRGGGRAIAQGLARAGAIVIVTDIDIAQAEATSKSIMDCGGVAQAFALDVTDPDGCNQLAETIMNEIGAVSILFNNAGVLLNGRIDEVGARERWNKTWMVNVDGPYNACSAFLPALKVTNGCIVNVASIQSFVGGNGAAAYIASKGAVAQFTKALAVELARYNIRVNAIAPGVIDTDMTSSVKGNDKYFQGLLAHIPMRRMGRPDELVGASVFLSSRDASYVTGVVLPIDGGYLTI